jgi:hypothetical protein
VIGVFGFGIPCTRVLHCAIYVLTSAALTFSALTAGPS